jgi:hypothetical protein
MCVVLCGFVFILPEARGRSLEEIASLWQKSDRENTSATQA